MNAVQQAQSEIAARVGTIPEAEVYRAYMADGIAEMEAQVPPEEQALDRLVHGLTLSSIVERAAHVDTIVATRIIHEKLTAENEHLRRANKTIHDTLTAEVKRLKLLVGEPVFDPLDGHQASDPVLSSREVPGHGD